MGMPLSASFTVPEYFMPWLVAELAHSRAPIVSMTSLAIFKVLRLILFV